MNTTLPFDDLATIVARTKGYLLTEQVAHEAVEALAEIARDVIGVATGAGVSVISVDGTRESVGATNDRVLEADTLQYDLGEGPCLSAWSTGEPDAFTSEDRRLLVNSARSAAVLLGHIQASDTPQRISEDVKASLADRDAVGVARGILMERFDLDKQEAMNHLIGRATDARNNAGVPCRPLRLRGSGRRRCGCGISPSPGTPTSTTSTPTSTV